eukprot:COSAG05_NODE_352_length_10911_cov_31.817139_7_plen_699_part_00
MVVALLCEEMASHNARRSQARDLLPAISRHSPQSSELMSNRRPDAYQFDVDVAAPAKLTPDEARHGVEVARLHREDLERLRREYREDMGKAQQQQNDMRDKKDAQLEALRKEKDEQLEQLRKEKDEQLERLRKEKDEQIASLTHAMLAMPSAAQSIHRTQERQVPPPQQQVLIAPSHQPSIAQSPAPTIQATDSTKTLPPPDHTPSLVSLDTLVAKLCAGGDDAETALCNTLEAMLQVLEGGLVSTPRQQRKALKEQCSRVEVLLEEMDSGIIARLAVCEVSDLTHLGEKLCAVQTLHADKLGADIVPTVTSALDELMRCSDLVVGASRQIISTDARVRLRGLESLRALPREILEQAVAAETKVTHLMVELAASEGRTDGERNSSLLGLVVLGLRNGAAVADVLESVMTKCYVQISQELFDGRLQGREGVMVRVGMQAVATLVIEMACKAPDVRERLESTVLREWAAAASTLVCSKARFQDIAPLLIESAADEDLIVASAAVNTLTVTKNVKTTSECAGVFLQSEPAQLAWAVRRRIFALGPVMTWKDLAQRLTADSLYSYMLWDVLACSVMYMPAVPHDGDWPEIIDAAVHTAQMNHEGQLAAQDKFTTAISFAFVVLTRVVRDRNHHPRLMHATAALLWSAGSDFMFVAASPAEFAAAVCVNLLGRNEGGLTVNKATVDRVLNGVHRYVGTPNSLL